MLRASLSSIGLSCASGFGALLIGMLFGMMLFGEDRGWCSRAFRMLMIAGSRRRLEKNGRPSLHTRSFLWGMAKRLRFMKNVWCGRGGFM